MASPGTPLFPLSPERVNGTRPTYGTSSLAHPQSPCTPDFTTSPLNTFKGHLRTSSDVQGMVARFNGLEIRDQTERTKRDELAVRRAEMAREMAEAETKRVKEAAAKAEKELEGLVARGREDVRRFKKEVDEGRERERRMAKRMEVVTDELHRARETHNHAQALYEKEIRRARKEAFKSSSALVKLQEELKATRTSLSVAKSGIEAEKQKAALKEHEAFKAQYQLIGVQESLSQMQERLKIVEEERDALKTSLKEEEVARIAAEGRIALPPSKNDEEDEDEFQSPRKSPTKREVIEDYSVDDDKENVLPTLKTMNLLSLQQELAAERQGRQHAESTVEFLKLECQFQCCSCRVAERNEVQYVHDDTFAEEMQIIKAAAARVMTPPASDAEEDNAVTMAGIGLSAPGPTPADSLPTPEDSFMEGTENTENEESAENTQSAENAENTEPLITFSPTSGTFHAIPSPPKGHVARSFRPLSTIISVPGSPAVEETAPAPTKDIQATPSARASAQSFHLNTSTITPNDLDPHEPESPEPQTPAASHPHTPLHREVRTVTTTIKVPLHFTPISTASSHPVTPATMPAHLSHRAEIAHHQDSESTPPTAPPSRPEPQTTCGETPGRGGLPFDRAAALAQIRERRGRARSLAVAQHTPARKPSGEAGSMTGPRRDISAPAIRGLAR